MARPEKVAVVEEVRTKLASADAAVLTEYRGLTVKELATLRAALRPASTEYKVFKNTLARRAAEDSGLAELVSMLEGPVAIAFVAGDAVAAAKALRDFGRTAPALVVKGGLLGGRVLTAADVAALAEIEPREVLLARLAGGFQAPLAKAAALFQALPRSLAYGVKALIDQRVAAGEAAAPAKPAEATPAEAAPSEAAPAGAAPTDTTPVEAEAGDTESETSTQTETEAAPDAAEATPAAAEAAAEPEGE
jgi:large subunit ribosomal protein L10